MQIEPGDSLADATAASTDQTFAFGPFRLFPARVPETERCYELPIVLTRMIGRFDIVDSMTADLPRLRALC